MKLNAIAEDIAYKLGDQFNMTLRESIKHTLIYYRAKYIRDDSSRTNSLATDYFQTAIMEMKQVNKLEDVGANLRCITQGDTCYAVINDKKYQILKSTTPVPKSVRLKGFGHVPYKFIGSVDRFTRFYYSEPVDLESKMLLPYRKQTDIYFFIANNYLYLLNSLKICNVLIEGVFVDPREVYKLCNEERFVDDNEFPIAEDLLMSIVDNIVTRSYPLVRTDGEVINIQKDDKDKNDV